MSQDTEKTEFIPFALPDIGQDEIDEVAQSLRSGWLTTGPKVQALEKGFAEMVGAKHCLAVISGTAALHLGLDVLGVGPGDEVITTPFTFTATAEVVRYLGAEVKFVDIDPATLNINPALIEPAIGERTRAVLPVHYGGLACDMKPVSLAAYRYGLGVVEDAAHALPSTTSGCKVGSISPVTAFSFYATKTMTTGEGGMVATDDDELAETLSVMRFHGINRATWDRHRSKKPKWQYDVVAPGYKYNMSDVMAAMGLHQMAKVERFHQRRSAIADAYDRAFAGLPLTLPPRPPEGEVHAWYLYTVRLTDDAPLKRDEFMERLSEMGVGTNVQYIPLHLLTYWKERYDLKPEDFPASLDAFQRCVSLPIYSKMTDGQVERVTEAVRELLG